jgi:hypothetical protein
MNKDYLKSSAKFIFLSIIMTVLWMFFMAIMTNLFGVDITQESSIKGLFLFFLAASINTAVVFTLIIKSKWYGWKLVGSISLIIFGVQFFMAQMESLYFNESLSLPINLIYAIIVAGLLLAVSFSMIAVKILGKWKKESNEHNDKISFNTNFIIKIILLAAIIYPVLYFSAGYFIAWQLPELRMLYSGSTVILPFFQHYYQTFQSDSLFYPFQIFRGFLWIGMAIVMMKFLKTSWKMKAFLVGITFALIMNAQHLIPNPYMSGSIPLYHFIETASSNFIWGFVIVWMLGRSKK